jgi:hypothetical protein
VVDTAEVKINMTKENTIPCQYCRTLNPVKVKTCIACGAPLEKPKLPKPKTKKLKEIPTKPEDKTIEEIKEIGEQVDDVYFTIMNTYAIAWRTIGEAIAIAISATIIGLAGGATEMRAVGVLGAILIGIAIGLTRKNFYIVLISAPAGAILGLIIGAIFWLFISPKIVVFIVTSLAIVGAILGGKGKRPFRSRNLWEKLRPFLGGLGGLAFGVIGMLLGWGISAAIMELRSLFI